MRMHNMFHYQINLYINCFNVIDLLGIGTSTTLNAFQVQRSEVNAELKVFHIRYQVILYCCGTNLHGGILTNIIG